jgi:hypothetical protein
VRSRSTSSLISSAAPLSSMRTRSATLTIAVLCFPWLATQACAQESPSNQPVSIQGTVVNSVTHEPIGRAQVYSQDNRFATMTDDQGHFEVPLPPQMTAGDGGVGTNFRFVPQSFVARKPGYLPEQSGEPNRVGPGANELTITLVPEAVLMGRILLEGPDSPDEVQVQLFHKEISDGLARWTPQNIVNTNSRGEYRFAELYPGDYRVGTHEVPDRDPEDFVPGAKVYGYPPVYFPEASDFPSSTIVHLSPGRVFQADISLARRQYYPIKISVANVPPQGAPINVNVTVRGDGAPGYSLGYEQSDRTIRGMLPNGIYVIEATSYSQQGATALMNLRVENAPVENASMTLLPNGTIDVQVKEEFTLTPPPAQEGVDFSINGGGARDRMNRQLQRYLNVMLEPFSDFGQGRGANLRAPVGPNDKSMVIDNVAPGRYWVRVNSSRGYAALVSSGGVDLLREPLVVGPGGSAAPIEITMRDDMASFDGTVEGANPQLASSDPSGAAAPQNSAPLAYVYCIPQPDSPGQLTQAWVSADGKINSQQMVPGVYRILAFKHPQNDLEYRNADAMRAYESKGQLVRLVGGQTEHLQLQLVSKAGEDAD